jgi:hypothetical protein
MWELTPPAMAASLRRKAALRKLHGFGDAAGGADPSTVGVRAGSSRRGQIGHAGFGARDEPGRRVKLSSGHVDQLMAIEHLSGLGAVQVAFPGGNRGGRDAIADQVARGARHSDEPVDRQHQDESDGGN